LLVSVPPIGLFVMANATEKDVVVRSVRPVMPVGYDVSLSRKVSLCAIPAGPAKLMILDFLCSFGPLDVRQPG
jgi:hypothetical protein